MIWLNRVVALVIVGLLHGCLADDRGAEKGSSSTTQKSIASKNHLPGAPKAIDPRILADRAFGEAPILAERVSKGRLPPVAERLPDHPLVVVPIDEIGRYGGTLRRALTGDIAQTPGVIKTLVENLMDYERPGSTRIEPNLAERHTFEDEGRTAIFKIRTGLKWSDGVPFTVDDILFWYHDMALNDDARSSALFPSNFLVEGKPIEMSKVDTRSR